MKKIILLIVLGLAFISLKSQDNLVSAVVALTGNVLNEVTRLPETVSIIVTDLDGNKVGVTRSIGSENGYYYVTGLKSGKSYKVSIKKKGYFEEEYSIVVPNSSKYLEMSKDFLVKPKEVGTKIKIPVAPFEYGKSKLRFGAEYILDDYSESLKVNPTVNVEIVCYPDKSNDADNQKITDERANALKQFLVTQGVDAGRITVKGSKVVDPDNPPPTALTAKGKRYIGTSYIVVKTI